MSSDDDLLEIIPYEQLAPDQIARWFDGEMSPTYKLRREPEDLFELELYGPRLAIWMDNKTLTYISTDYNHPEFSEVERFLRFDVILHFGRHLLVFSVVAQNDDAVAETAAFWWASSYPEECSCCIIIGNNHIYPTHDNTYMKFDAFNFSVVKPTQLESVSSKNTDREVEFHGETLTVDQSNVLATRPDPIRLKLSNDFHFEDDGDAFVQALSNRDSSFGSLILEDSDMPLSDSNVELLLQLNMFEKLALPVLGMKQALLPFSAPVKSLDYSVDSEKLLAKDVCSLNNIVAKEFDLTIQGVQESLPEELIRMFLRRLSALGHFEKIALRVGMGNVAPDVPDTIVRELVCVTASNEKLESLDLSMSSLDWGPCLDYLFQAIENHKGLRRITIEVYPEKLDPDYSWLKRLLSHNRKIEVYGFCDRLVTDHWEIDELYSLNRFYNGSVSLKTEQQCIRTSLVATTLTESAFGNFQYTALLLTNYTDSLCELIDLADMESLADSGHTGAERRTAAYESADRTFDFRTPTPRKKSRKR